jgi:hypothetical protein
LKPARPREWVDLNPNFESWVHGGRNGLFIQVDHFPLERTLVFLSLHHYPRKQSKMGTDLKLVYWNFFHGIKDWLSRSRPEYQQGL